MNFVKFLLTIIIFLFTVILKAQTATLTGTVRNVADNQPIPLVDVVLEGTSYYTTTDIDGNFKIQNIKPGVYNVLVSLLGYNDERITELTISNVRTQKLEILLKENVSNLQEVVVKTSAFKTKSESPISVTRIGVTEIMRSPGANRDISFVVRNLPGVATTNSFRNDLIVRGGSPSENKFFMDGIEIPNINHFATQGSSGGPVGMINVNFIQNVDFYTGSFPVSRGNALSSVMDITTKKANSERLSGSVTLGSSDFGLTLDTPTGKNSGMLLSVRRSYLQFLFEALKLPFLPIYNDFQYVHDFKLNDKNQLTILGLGAIDNFKLNTTVNDGVTDTDILERNQYILNNIPKYEQWNYAIGANWKNFTENGYNEWVLSRNMLNNTAEKYRYNIENTDNLLLNYLSQEIENKFRWQHHHTTGNWKWYAGIGLERVKYVSETFQKINVGNTVQTLDFNSELSFQKYALFAQTNRNFMDEKLETSFSIRTDFTDYASTMSNPFKQLSPRFSVSYKTSEIGKIVANVGKYFQLPAYTIMGFRDNAGTLVNQQNGLKYIDSWQLASGYQWTPKQYFQLKLESFYKIYKHYPFDLNNQISLANLGSDFGVIGNTPVASISKGRSYGFEFSGTQKLTNKIFGSFSYTFVRSEFEDINQKYVPSSWDNRHVLNVVGGYKFNKNWELGMKFRMLGGAPYTPIDIATSSLQNVWDVRQQAVLDYSLLNTERSPISHGMDLRIDKKWYFNKWALNLYLDLQNVYNFKAKDQDYFNVIYDATGVPLPADATHYQYKLIENESGTVVPSIGLMVDF